MKDSSNEGGLNADAKAEELCEDTPTSASSKVVAIGDSEAPENEFLTALGDSKTNEDDERNHFDAEAVTAKASIDEDIDDMKDACCSYRATRHWSCCYRILLRWPRMSAILFGVIMPMFFLIFLSVLFGYFLACAESPMEIQQNDAAMVQSMLQLSTIKFVVNTTETIPALCLGLFFLQQNVSYVDEYLLAHLLQPSNSSLAAESPDLVSPGRDVVVNSSQALHFMVQCGQVAGTLVERTIRNTSAVYRDEVPGDLTFNWIRCYPGARGLGRASETPASIDEYRFDAQYQWYAETWKQSQNETYYTLLAEYLAGSNKTTPEEAALRAKNESYQMATGAPGCAYNVPSSAWFWFTILSTVGYGNQAPETSAGRTMVFTLGFFSILAFGGILAVAGFIASAIFDDFMVRLHLKAVTHPLVASVVWGCCYYVWMVALAAVTSLWKHARVGDESFTMSDGFWFAYISSTTIGLGDIYLNPEVLLYADMISFPLLWLGSFVLIAAFLAKFGETWVSLCGPRSYVQDVLGQLKNTDMLEDLPGAGMIILARIRACCRREFDDANTPLHPVAGSKQSDSA